MAASLTPSNTFNTQSGSVPASQLDTNFSQVASAVNALTTFSNFYVDSGGANAIAVTVPSPQVVAYAAGLALQIKVAAANTGATTINVNALGAVNLVTPGGSALPAGQLSAGGIATVLFDGSNFQLQSFQLAATGVTAGSYTSTNLTVDAYGRITAAANGSGGGGGGSSGSFTATCPDISGSPTQLVYYAISNGIATIYNENATAAGTATTSTYLTLTGMPAALIPVRTPQPNALFSGAQDSNAPCGSSVTIGTNGIIYFSKVASLTFQSINGWTASTGRSVPLFNFTYSLV